MSDARDTIFAPATAPGRAALAVMRVSGPQAGRTLVALAGSLPRPRQASVRRLTDAAGASLDDALVVWFPGPKSYTGEDVVELHLHGGRGVVDGVIEALAAQPGLRLAEPGEFTRRAFENGRLDLTQAEAVADLVDAETAAQRRQALSQLGGALSRRQERWRALFLDALAWLQAAIDFPDEDLPEIVEAQVRPLLGALAAELEAATADAERGRRVRDGYRIALIGAPNAGKSTLLNALAGRDAAIVSAMPGTTRDVIEVPMTLAGYAVLLADTAGLREARDEIEAEGVSRARRWAEDADLRLWVVDGTVPITEPPRELTATDLTVVSKADLPSIATALEYAVVISARRQADIQRLTLTLTERVLSDLSGSDFPSGTRLRHAEALSAARASIVEALERMADVELAAEALQRGLRVLEGITGRIDAEHVLGRIFSAFCIGK